MLLEEVRPGGCCSYLLESGHVAGTRHNPCGQLELRIDRELPDPTARILAYCESGKVSTLATATLRTMGDGRAVALDGGFRGCREAACPVEETAAA